jgi:Xanthosine triphosphate pyrophosphatase
MVHLRVSYDEVQSSDLEEVVAKGMKEIKSRGIEDFIIDDSGLFVDSLAGFPGVWSAYVQKTISNKGILKLMAGESDRNARFKCCIGCNINGEDIVVTGVCEGSILQEERGSGGFGFDPIFTHDGERSFAEIPIGEKNEVSHRGNAVRFLMERLEGKVPDNKS